MTSPDRLAVSVRALSSKGLSARKIAQVLRVSERRVFQLRAMALEILERERADLLAEGIA